MNMLSSVSYRSANDICTMILCRVQGLRRCFVIFVISICDCSVRAELRSGSMLSVLNILMQLRKVCNHPNLFEQRPIESPYVTRALHIAYPACVFNVVDRDDDKMVLF